MYNLMTENNENTHRLDYEKIIIYPNELSREKKEKLSSALDAIGVKFDFERYL